MWVPNMVLHAMIISCSCNLECCDEENIIRMVSKTQTLSDLLKLFNSATIWPMIWVKTNLSLPYKTSVKVKAPVYQACNWISYRQRFYMYFTSVY